MRVVSGNKVIQKVGLYSSTSPSLKKTIAVIIPCYNQSQFVQEAVKSCLTQTARPEQIIVLLMDKMMKSRPADA